MKIGIVIGSVREDRPGPSIASWVAEQAAQHSDATFEIIDLKDFQLPVFDGPMPPMMLNKQYGDERIQKYSAVIDSFDGFIFVTPEYNGSIPGGFKNAIDYLAPEWNDKAIGFVGYSYHGGHGAIKHWRDVMAVLKANPVDSQVNINLGSDVADGVLNATEEQKTALKAVVEQVTAS